MDEPTSSLEPREVDRCFGVVDRLRASGSRGRVRQPPARRAVPGLRPVTVLRDGRLVHTGRDSPSSTGCGSSR